MQNGRTMLADGIASSLVKLARGGLVGACAIWLCACNTDQQVTGVPDVPVDYRQRHPITLTEANHTLEIFVGASRGELNAWRRGATGGVVINLPVGASNQHAAADSVPMIRSILAAGGVPADGIIVRHYQAPGPTLAAVRMSYPRVAAQAGPCGLWPEDVGPSLNRDYFENQPPWNFGCATQRNLAAMVDDPADLVQPRGETPPYTMRRTTVVEKYRQGVPTATQYPSADSAKISTSIGQ
jgi:pilus assembly protein CpaD